MIEISLKLDMENCKDKILMTLFMPMLVVDHTYQMNIQ